MTKQSKNIDGERTISKKMWIKRGMDRIKKLSNAGGPTYLNHMKEDLPLVGMEIVTLIPVEIIEAQSETKQTKRQKSQGTPPHSKLYQHNAYDPCPEKKNYMRS